MKFRFVNVIIAYFLQVRNSEKGEKIYESCKADGVPEPEYTIHPKDIMIKFTAPEDRVITLGKNRGNDRVNDSEMIVLNLLYADPAYTYAEIAERADISRKIVAARMKFSYFNSSRDIN